MRTFFYFFILIAILSCTHYKSIPFSELENSKLIGRWEMSLPPYFIDIDCNGSMSFVKPSELLYGDQRGSGFIITEFKENKIITGPIMRVGFSIEEWPHDEEGTIRMTLDNRIWHRSKSYTCEDVN